MFTSAIVSISQEKSWLKVLAIVTVKAKIKLLKSEVQIQIILILSISCLEEEIKDNVKVGVGGVVRIGVAGVVKIGVVGVVENRSSWSNWSTWSSCSDRRMWCLTRIRSAIVKISLRLSLLVSVLNWMKSI